MTYRYIAITSFGFQIKFGCTTEPNELARQVDLATREGGTWMIYAGPLCINLHNVAVILPEEK